MRFTPLWCSILLAGCAYWSPQRHVESLSPNLPRYNTPECLAARTNAMAYDDRMAERVAAGAGVGHAGPPGIAAAMAIDMKQHEIREATKRAVDQACT